MAGVENSQAVKISLRRCDDTPLGLLAAVLDDVAEDEVVVVKRAPPCK